MVIGGSKGGALFAGGRYLVSHAVTFPAAHPFYFYIGADQFVVFGRRYLILAACICMFLASIVLTQLFDRSGRAEIAGVDHIPLQLYLVVELAIIFLPDYVHAVVFQQPASAIIPRLTLLSAVLGCSLLAMIPPRKWHWLGGSCLLAVFFAFIFQDTGKLAIMGNRVEQLVQTLPPVRWL
jgi:hypothetical protein